MPVRSQYLKVFYTLVLVMGLSGIMPAHAQKVDDPIQLIDQVTSKMFKALNKNKEKIKNNPKHILRVVDNIIIPHVDFIDMARWVAGRNAWKAASPSIQKGFVNEFRTLVVNTYAQALNAYTNEKLEFEPLRAGFENKKRILISSHIIRIGQPKIHLEFRLVRSGTTWKLYDLIIEGVSLLKGYQAQFSSRIQQNGLEAVISDLKHHNTKG